MTSKKPSHSDTEQVRKFRDAARSIKADQSERQFNGVLKRVAKASQREAAKPAKKKRSK